MTAIWAAGNNQIFQGCDEKCIVDGRTFRQNKCAGSAEGNGKRDTSCESCWKSTSLETGCLTPFVIAGNELSLAQCLCQPGKIDVSTHQAQQHDLADMPLGFQAVRFPVHYRWHEPKLCLRPA